MEEARHDSRVVQISLRTSIKSLVAPITRICGKRGSLEVGDPSQTWLEYLKRYKIPVDPKWHIVSCVKGKFKSAITTKISELIGKRNKGSKVIVVTIQTDKFKTVYGDKGSKQQKKAVRKTEPERNNDPPVLTPEIRLSVNSDCNTVPIFPTFKVPQNYVGQHPKGNTKKWQEGIKKCSISFEGGEQEDDDISPDDSVSQVSEFNANVNATPFDSASQCSAVSGATMFSNEIPYQTRGDIIYDKELNVRGRILETLTKNISNRYLLGVKKEIDGLKARRKWSKISSFIPTISLFATELFNDKNFPK